MPTVMSVGGHCDLCGSSNYQMSADYEYGLNPTCPWAAKKTGAKLSRSKSTRRLGGRNDQGMPIWSLSSFFIHQRRAKSRLYEMLPLHLRASKCLRRDPFHRQDHCP